MVPLPVLEELLATCSEYQRSILGIPVSETRGLLQGGELATRST